MDPERFYTENASEYADANAREKLPESYTNLFDSFLEDVEGESILDAGCGPGRDTDYMEQQGYDAVGVDLSEGMIEHAREGNRGSFIRADLRDLPFDDRVFDGVWCNAAVFLLEPEEMPSAIEELARVTAEDGLAQISFKLGEGTLQKEMGGKTVEQYMVPEEEARKMIEDAGYEVREFQRHEMPAGFAFGNYLLER